MNIRKVCRRSTTKERQKKALAAARHSIIHSKFNQNGLKGQPVVRVHTNREYMKRNNMITQVINAEVSRKAD